MGRFNELREVLNENFEENAFVPGNDYKFLDIRRVPTGILELDIALAGGVPIGRVITIWGPKSSGKSSLCEKITASFQQHSRKSWVPLEMCPYYKAGEDPEDLLPITTWVDVEGTYTPKHAEEMGIDTSRVHVGIPTHGEEVVTMVQKTIESGLSDLIIIDSIAAMSPLNEVNRDLTEKNAQVGEHAKLVSQFLRKIGMSVNKARRERGEAPTILLINQQRIKINTMGGPSGKMKPGGESQGFAASVEIQLLSNRVNLEKDKSQNVKAVSYGEAFFKIEKSKVCTPNLSGRYRLWLADDKDHRAGDTDEIEKLVKIAIQEGIIEKTASKVMYNKVNYKTQKQLRECLREDYNFFSEIRTKILDKLLPKSMEARRALEEINLAEETINPLMEITGKEKNVKTKKAGDA